MTISPRPVLAFSSFAFLFSLWYRHSFIYTTCRFSFRPLGLGLGCVGVCIGSGSGSCSLHNCDW